MSRQARLDAPGTMHHVIVRGIERGKIVADLAQLDQYPCCGHAVVLGRANHGWQDRKYVLAWFGRDERAAIPAYRK